jgi:hypothetical protein
MVWVFLPRLQTGAGSRRDGSEEVWLSKGAWKGIKMVQILLLRGVTEIESDSDIFSSGFGCQIVKPFILCLTVVGDTVQARIMEKLSSALLRAEDVTMEESERPTKRGKMVPPSSTHAGRRKATAKQTAHEQEDINKTAKSYIRENDENTPAAVRGGLKIRLSSKLLDFDTEGMFCGFPIALVGIISTDNWYVFQLNDDTRK